MRYYILGLAIILGIAGAVQAANFQADLSGTVNCTLNEETQEHDCTVNGTFTMPAPVVEEPTPEPTPNPTPEPAPEPPPAGDPLMVNRALGTAPLAVFFDGANGARDVQSFQDISYSWNFGDATSGALNIATGPLAAHVYTQPGNYRAVVTFNGQTRTADITVQDPNDVFSGKTICLSSSDNFDGCPNGATHQSIATFEAAISAITPGTRLMFRRGDEFSSNQRVYSNVAGPVMLDAFGVGSLPIIRMTHTASALRLSANNYKVNDWIIANLHFEGPSGGTAIDAENTISKVTFYGLEMHNLSSGLVIPESKPDYYGDPMHSDVAIANCTSSNDNRSTYGLYVAGIRLMIVGNTMSDGGHIVRTPHVTDAVISHNNLSNPGSTQHIIKLHAQALRDGTARSSKNFVIVNNVLTGTVNDWNVGLGPQSARYNELVENGVVEGNQFISGPANQVQLLLWCKDVVVRNNVFDETDARYKTAILETQRGIESPPEGNRVQTNRCVINGSDVPCVIDLY